MQLTTKTQAPVTGKPIRLGEKFFSLGSCFAENIAVKLAYSGFGVTWDTFGVLYNPASIACALEVLDSGKLFTVNDLVTRDGKWFSPFFHSRYGGNDPVRVAETINGALDTGRKALAESDNVLISLGTPTVYTVSQKFALVQSAARAGAVVANCHKFPADFYDNRRMDVTGIATIYKKLSNTVLKGKRVIYTVSPIRYLKDGLHGSNLGKAVLQLAVEKICTENPGSYYFPAYEILNDELRDYRFYAEDMVHPSRTAVEYIWRLFREWTIDPAAQPAMDEIAKLSKAMEHRPATASDSVHIEFILSMVEKTRLLAAKYPCADLNLQMSYFESELVKYQERGEK